MMVGKIDADTWLEKDRSRQLAKELLDAMNHDPPIPIYLVRTCTCQDRTRVLFVSVMTRNTNAKPSFSSNGTMHIRNS